MRRLFVGFSAFALALTVSFSVVAAAPAPAQEETEVAAIGMVPQSRSFWCFFWGFNC